MFLLNRMKRAVYRRFLRRLDAARTEQLIASLGGCGENLMLYPPVVIHTPEALTIGDNTSIAPFVHMWCGAYIEIGSRCMIGSHVAITSLGHDFREEEMWKSMVKGKVVIEDDVMLGAHSVVLPGVTIGRGAAVGAGSLVTRDVPRYAVCFGSPARVREFRPESVQAALEALVVEGGR
ncbi:DapH/DapD/GlmU-related protein [Desulfococcus sp.]|uniref:acyltransferase n=1 Tax=Desulfococcus sp. TaxID=2025834 RepID=UPI00359419E9